jgi:hypothetical protein
LKLSQILHSKKWIAAWAIFLVIFILLFVFVSYLLRPINSNRRNIAGYYAETTNTLDMVYIGGSACFVFWMPYEAWNQYGFTSYNFACNSLPASNFKASIQEVLKTQDPSLLIIDARSFEYMDRKGLTEVYIRNFADSTNYSWDRLMFLNQYVPTQLNEGEDNNFWNYCFDIAKYHTLWKSLGQLEWPGETVWKYADNHESQPYKGYEFITDAYEVISQPDYAQITSQRPFNDQVDSVLTELLDYCSTLDCEILFIVSPYAETEEQKELYNYLEEQTKLFGYDFIDTNDYIEEIGLDYSTDFYNETHTNALGAKKYTDFLSAYLHENYSLPDHRNDSDYSSWQQGYENWEQDLNEWQQKIKDNIAQGNTASE